MKPLSKHVNMFDSIEELNLWCKGKYGSNAMEFPNINGVGENIFLMSINFNDFQEVLDGKSYMSVSDIPFFDTMSDISSTYGMTLIGPLNIDKQTLYRNLHSCTIDNSGHVTLFTKDISVPAKSIEIAVIFINKRVVENWLGLVYDITNEL